MCATGVAEPRGREVKLGAALSPYYNLASGTKIALPADRTSNQHAAATFDRSDLARRELNPYAALSEGPLASQPMAMLMVRHAYRARFADEVELFAGDVVQGFRRSSGWWLGRSRDRVGIFPANHVVAWERLRLGGAAPAAAPVTQRAHSSSSSRSPDSRSRAPPRDGAFFDASGSLAGPATPLPPRTAPSPTRFNADAVHAAAAGTFDESWLANFSAKMNDVGGWIAEQSAVRPMLPSEAYAEEALGRDSAEDGGRGDLSGLNDRGVPLAVMRALAAVEANAVTPEAAALLTGYLGGVAAPAAATPVDAAPPSAPPGVARAAAAPAAAAAAAPGGSAALAPAPATGAAAVAAPAPAAAAPPGVTSASTAAPAAAPSLAPAPAILRTPEQLAELEESFKMFDVDGGGSVDASELDGVLRKVGIEISASELERAMAEVDTDGNGNLDFQEFLQMMDGIESGKSSTLGALMKKARNLHRGAVVGEPIAIDDAKKLFAAGAKASGSPDAISDMAFVTRALAASYLCEGLEKETIAFLANSAERTVVKAGAPLFAQGDVADDGYAVARGALVVDGAEAGQGTIVGESALALPGKREECAANASASEVCVVYKLPRSMFKLAIAGAADLAKERAQAALHAVPQLATELSAEELEMLVPLVERVVLDAGGALEGAEDTMAYVAKGALGDVEEGGVANIDALLRGGGGPLAAGGEGADCLVLRRSAICNVLGDLATRLDRNVVVQALKYNAALEHAGTKFQHRVVGKELGLAEKGERRSLATGDAFDETACFGVVLRGSMVGGEGGGGTVSRLGCVGEQVFAMTGRGEAAQHAKDNATAFAWAAGAEGATVVTFTAEVLAAHVAQLDQEHRVRLRAAIRRTKRTLLMGAALGEKACAAKIAENKGTVATMVVSDPDKIERLRTLGMGSFGRVFLARLKGAARTLTESSSVRPQRWHLLFGSSSNRPRSQHMPPTPPPSVPYYDRAHAAESVFALKALQKGAVVDMGQQKNVVVEKSVMAECDHPFVVKLVASYQDPMLLFMGMPVVRGGEVAHRLAKATKLDEDGDEEPIGLDALDAAFYTVCVAYGTAHMHESGFIWRDLKPENVMIGADGYAKCVDFGLAKRLDFANGKDKTYTMCGTPE
jgi:CRP-like cAMP-binding protein